jgi:four helix bundle protein
MIGTGVAQTVSMTGVSRVQELIAFQLARTFKRQVYDIVRNHPAAHGDWRYRSQLWDAASGGEANIDEGFQRFGPREFSRFLSYARASLSEARTRLLDGVDRGYFSAECCAPIAEIGARAISTVIALQLSQERFIEADGPADHREADKPAGSGDRRRRMKRRKS